ncbi:MAG: HlyC/CorC family transporter [Lentimicrobiaceae bacterium]|nr:HlyC/CorC family transporter [Lentimicrobiaceae bacterium]MBR7176354.1 HlyC/CorC family transporter [Bacteroidales bacterium]
MNDIYIVILSLLASGMFSGMEIAFMSTNRLQLELDLKKRKFSAKIINKFFKNQSQFIGCLLLCNNIANVVYGIAIARILEPFVTSILPEVITNDFTVLLCQTILSTLLVLITGEFLPKIIFGINPNKTMNIFALPAMILFIILYPIILIYIGISELIIKYILRVEISHSDYKLNTVDLNDYIKEYANPDDDNEDIQQGIELFQNAIEFHTVKLRECMVPRPEIQAIDIKDGIDEARRLFEETKHSKLLVYDNNIDNIIGYIHINDILTKISDIKHKIRPIEFFPETYSAQELLKHLSKKKQSIAVVVDEFGGTSGIISIEDLIEEIFGEIEDEYDVEDSVEETINEDDYIFSARLEIDYLNKNYKFNFPESDDYETLAGYIIHYHESIPQINEEIVIGNYIFKIIKATDTKLEEVEIKNNQ